MILSSQGHRLGVLLAAVVVLTAAPTRAQLADWPGIFEPLVVPSLNLTMDPADWVTIQNDDTLSIEVPALFWADGESSILVAIRRKSADPLTAVGSFAKVSYKIDINELVSGQSWHGLKKLSLENGDDQDVVSEGMAWYLHRLASGPEGYAYGYNVGFGSWVTLTINGVDNGVYLSAEQVDKSFLQNRGLYTQNSTWLYKKSDLGPAEIKVGSPDSPTTTTLCYKPFDVSGSCSTPDSATLAATLPALVDMRGMLTEAAVDAFSKNGDAIFSKGKNFYYADFAGGETRVHFPWDQDSVFPGSGTGGDIYAIQSDYGALLAVPEFRDLYTEIFNDLLCGPWSVASLTGVLDDLEAVLTPALAADPNNQIGGSVAGHFQSLRDWMTDRHAELLSQLDTVSSCDFCQTDLGFAGPGSMVLSLCGESLTQAGALATVNLTGAAPSTTAFIPLGLINAPTPLKGGIIVPIPWVVLIDAFSTNGSGQLSIPVTATGSTLVTFYMQAVVNNSGTFEFSNALEVVFGI
jgi:hypothetical protein